MGKFNKKLDAIREAFYVDKFTPEDTRKKFSEGLVVKLPVGSTDLCLLAKSHDSFRLQNEIISEIYENAYLFDNYSLQEVNKAVAADIFDVLKGIKTDYSFFKELFSAPPIEHLIVRFMSGMKIQNISSLGKFFFFYNENDLASKAQEIQKKGVRPSFSAMFPDLKYPCIGTTVTAVGEEKAREKANMLFQRFENVVQFMIGRRWNEFYVKIVSKDVLMRDEDICINSKATGANFSWKGPLGRENNYSIDDPHFSNTENAMIWQLIEKESRSDWEEKILRSISWVGKGLRNEDITISFLQMLFSLESLFVVNAPLFLNESITAKIADAVAYALTNQKEQRIEITKRMKKMYDLRSKVVHSGKEGVSLKRSNELFSICKAVLISLFRVDNLKAIKSNSDLSNWFNIKKYS